VNEDSKLPHYAMQKSKLAMTARASLQGISKTFCERKLSRSD